MYRSLPVPLVLTLMLGLAGCAAPLAIDGRYHAVSQDSRVRFIVLHFTAENFAESLRLLTTQDVSSHYLVAADPPTIYRLVDENRRAWHAGPSYWQGQVALNATSVGVEIVNAGDRDHPGGPYAPFPARQIDQVIALVRDVQRRHAVKPHHIVAHGEIQPQGKTDPGPMFPWKRLADAGLIPWPDEAAVQRQALRYAEAAPGVAWFQERLAAYGFDVPRDGQLNEATRRVVSIFQMKFRPARYDGAPDAETAGWLDVVTAPGGLQLRAPDGSWHPYAP
jgi:N-acetylmuramoyl-L-alanine amidase